MLEFLQRSLTKSTDPANSSEKWVRNQAMQNFGQIIHGVYLKVKNHPKLPVVCNSFYDLELLKQESEKTAADDSFTPDDDLEKMKESWAYNLPCVLLINKDWAKLKPVYSVLYTDASAQVKKSLAASLCEIVKLHLDEPFMIQVIQSFAKSENEDVKAKVMPQIVDFIKLVQADKQLSLVTTLIKPILEDKPAKPSYKSSVAKSELLEALFTKTSLTPQ